MSEDKTPYVVSIHEPEDQRHHPIFRMFDRPVAFQRCFVTLTGSITAALMLSQAVYWSSRASNPAGWFYKSADEWEQETGMTRHEQEGARKRLRQFEWWQEDLRKANGVPTVHYRIDAVGFAQTVQMDLAKSANPILRKVENGFAEISEMGLAKSVKSLTETTTETTTSTAADRKPQKPETAAPPPTPTDDAMALVNLIHASGMIYLDHGAMALAAQLVEAHGWQRCADGVDKVKEAHQTKAKKGQRGIVAPLAYLRSILEEQKEVAAERDSRFEPNAWQILLNQPKPDYLEDDDDN